jgi:hypothetical protein
LTSRAPYITILSEKSVSLNVLGRAGGPGRELTTITY